MRASETYRALENSPVAHVIFYFTQNILSNLEEKNMGEITKEIKTGKTPSKTNHRYYENATYPWFKPEDIGSSIYLEETNNKISEFAVKANAATIFSPKTLLINAIGDIGRMSILKIEASSNQQITGISFKENIMPEYVLFYLLPRRKLFEDKSSTTTLPILNQKKICSINIKVPEIAIQKEFVKYVFYCLECFQKKELPTIRNFKLESILFDISTLFFTVYYKQNSLINNLSEDTITISKLRQSVLQEAVQGNLVPQKEKDEPALELLKKIKAEKEKLIKEKKIKKDKYLPPVSKGKLPYESPKGWEWVRVGQIFTTNSGSTPSRSNPAFWGGKIPWLKSGELNDNINIIKSEEYITEEGFKNSSVKMFEKGSVVMALYGATAGKLGILGIDTTTNQAVCNFVKNSFVNEKYLYYVLFAFRPKIISECFGGAQPNISQDYVNKMLFPLPPLAEQKRIVEKVDQLMKLCDELEFKIQENQKNSTLLMQVVLREAFEA